MQILTTEQSLKAKRYNFVLQLFFLCICYGICEFYYISHVKFSVDEFLFSYSAYQYKQQLPYRDFMPYKTVLGYYFLLVPLSIFKGVLTTLLQTKVWITILNSILFFLSALYLSKFFKKSAVLLTLALLFLTDIVIAYSSDIRVDFFAYWFALFSFLCLIEKRFILAGILLGLGFATSQKVLWYLFASNMALCIEYLFFSRRFHTLKNILKFNAANILVIGIYILIWTYFANFETVIASTFLEASLMYQLDWYNSTRYLFWTFTLSHNPLPILLWPLPLLSLVVTFPEDAAFNRRGMIVIYSQIILLCLIPYKQIFPYYFQIAIPVFLLIYTAFIDWCMGLFQTQQIKVLIRKKIILYIFLVYFLGFGLAFVTFKLFFVYILILSIPGILLALILWPATPSIKKFYLQILCITLITIGVLAPLQLFIIRLHLNDGAYQKANLTVIQNLLDEQSSYIAGTDLLYNSHQPILALQHLTGPAIDFLYYPTPELKQQMLASLYHDPNASVESVIQEFDRSKVKFYVNNIHMNALPPVLKNYLHRNFQHYWGSIYTYAPEVKSGSQNLSLRLQGNYQIISQDKYIQINGSTYLVNQVINLNKGLYTTRSRNGFRLKLLVAKNFLPDEFKEDTWLQMY